MNIKEKILTPKHVKILGLDKVSVITADMLKGYTSIEMFAFYSCIDLISVSIPNSITSIGNYAFQNCTDLISVTIPDSVTNIGDHAFFNCNSLTSIKIPNSITSIGEYAFSLCDSLTSITIPNGVTNIGDKSFFDCRGLTSIEIPNSVTSIGELALYGCSSLTSVTIGDKTYKKQFIINSKCKAYKGFNIDMTCRDFQYEEGKTYELEDEPKLCKSGFHACLNLTDVFNYYYGEFGKNMVIHEVELEGVSVERSNDSKIVAKRITIGKRIL